MHRLTARLLLVLLLASVIAPVALAATSPQKHDCCMRKCCAGKPPHTHPATETSFDTLPCCHQDCSRSVTVSMWAELPLPVRVAAASPSELLPLAINRLPRRNDLNAAHCVRGPPFSSIA